MTEPAHYSMMMSLVGPSLPFNPLPISRDSSSFFPPSPVGFYSLDVSVLSLLFLVVPQDFFSPLPLFIDFCWRSFGNIPSSVCPPSPFRCPSWNEGINFQMPVSEAASSPFLRSDDERGHFNPFSFPCFLYHLSQRAWP